MDENEVEIQTVESDPDIWYESDKEVLFRAMLKAKEAFNRYINDELQIEGSLFDIDITGYILTRDYTDIESEVAMPADIKTSLKNKKEVVEQ